MIEYPSISDNKYCFDEDYIVQPKYDGSSGRSTWTRKKGFSKFGTRHRLVDNSDPVFGKIPELFLNKYSEPLSKIFSDNRFEEVTAFFEFFGPNSFAGYHEESDIKDVMLFDIHVYKKGFMLPQDFYKLCKPLLDNVTPKLYDGRVNQTLIEQVNSFIFPGMTFEGVICKAKKLNKHKQIHMFKIKNFEWYVKLKNICKSDSEFEIRK